MSLNLSYSGQNDVTRVTLPTGGSETINYGEGGNPGSHYPTSIFDFQNHSTSDKNAAGYSRSNATYLYDYGGSHNLTQAKDKNGHTWTFAYTGKGLMTKMTDADANASGSNPPSTNYSYTFDASNSARLTEMRVDLPTVSHGRQQGSTIVDYDAVGRTCLVRDGAGNTSVFTYDSSDRITRIDYFSPGTGPPPGSCPPPQSSGDFVSYSYDPDGNLTGRQDDSYGNVSMTYDGLNRLEKENPSNPADQVITYYYDEASNLTQISEGSSTSVPVATYTYSKVDMATSVTDSDGNQTTFAYGDPRDTLRTETDYPNGVKMKVTYDASDRQSDTTVTGPGGATLVHVPQVDRLQDAETTDGNNNVSDHYHYAMDPNGNIITKTVGSSDTNYLYNEDNELYCSYPGAQVSSQNCGSITNSTSYGYDGAGELTSMQPPSGSPTTFAYNDKSQTTSYTPPSGTSVAMSYQDASQVRLLSEGNLRYGYNTTGLAHQGPNSGTANTTTFVRDNLGTLAEERVAQSGSSAAHYYYYYYLFDSLGSVIGLTNDSGSLVGGTTYRYEPYGKMTQDPTQGTGMSNPWAFASGFYDFQNGLYKFGTRWYDSDIIRWTQMDPRSGNLSNPMTLNRYLYLRDAPLSGTDSTGMFCFTSGCLLNDVSTVAGYVYRTGFALMGAYWGARAGAGAGCAVGEVFDPFGGCIPGAVAGSVVGAGAGAYAGWEYGPSAVGILQYMGEPL